MKSRGGVVARDTGGYNAYAKDGKGGWNDEVLVGDEVSKKVRGEVAGWDRGSGEEEVEGERERLVEGERRMEGDELADRMRLDRQGGRTLYLVVRRGVGGEWMFPTGEVVGRESLYQVCLLTVSISSEISLGIALTQCSTVSPTHPRLLRRPQHEHLVRRACTNWPPDHRSILCG